MTVPLSFARRSLAAIALVLLAPSCAAVRSAPGPVAIDVNRTHEVRLLPPSGADPFAIRAEVVAPSGARTEVTAFALPVGVAFRFRAREPGIHRWRAVLDGREIARGEVRAADAGAAGQVVLRDGALVGEDGRPFHPLGENRFNVYDPTWSDGLAPQEYVARMAAEGMNTLRVFVFSACGREGSRRPGCLEPALGRFDPAAAAAYDAIFEAAERDGVKVVLSLFAIGFTPGDPWKGWEDNPYAAARGGPARTPAEFFTDPVARDAARRRLRYVLARWGASPALLAVDLLNEPEWDGRVDEDLWIPWAEDLARTWKAEDPYGHPVTLGSVGLHWNVTRDERPWWESAGCDVVQWHRYGRDVYEVHDLARALVDTIRDTRRYGKPVLVGEFAYGGEPKPAYDHTHVGIWASTMAGAGVLAHSAPPFEIDSDEPMTPERARHFRVLADFLRRAEAEGPLGPAPDPEVSVSGATALALGSGRVRALWILAPRARYGTPVTGAQVRMPDLPPGEYRVRWLDDVSGDEIAESAVRLGGDAAATVPPFTRHVAGIAVPVERGRDPSRGPRARTSPPCPARARRPSPSPFPSPPAPAPSACPG